MKDRKTYHVWLPCDKTSYCKIDVSECLKKCLQTDKCGSIDFNYKSTFFQNLYLTGIKKCAATLLSIRTTRWLLVYQGN